MAGLDRNKFEAAYRRSLGETGTSQSSGVSSSLDELWSMVEAAGEQTGLFDKEIREHLGEVTKDIRSWRKARLTALLVAIPIVALTFTMLAALLLRTDVGLRFLGLGADSVRIAYLAGAFGLVFGLTALIVRGAFAQGKPSEGVGVVPESIKTLAETLGSLVNPHKS